jgi:multidrug efflux system membrane fusion protein
MRVRSSYLVVGAIVALVAAYLVVRPLLGPAKSGDANAATPSAALAQGGAPPLVQVSLIPEVQRPYALTIRGRTQAIRMVVVRSETAGNVAETPVLQGTFVRAGQVLCRLAVDARAAALAQAKADLQSKQLQMQASQNLAQRGFRSQTQVLTDEAARDSAAAVLRQAEVALAQVDIRAPFAGVFDHRDAEIGSYLAPGQSCGTMIELDPILIVGDVPETDVTKLRVGEAATAKLVSGEVIHGSVRDIAHDADPQTRTYRVEVVAPNPGNRIASGLSADVQVDAGVGGAHLVPASALVLDSAGRQGLRYVGGDGRIEFSPVKVLEETHAGLWVSGLSGPVRVVTVGQDYVSEGQRVRVAQE